MSEPKKTQVSGLLGLDRHIQALFARVQWIRQLTAMLLGGCPGGARHPLFLDVLDSIICRFEFRWTFTTEAGGMIPENQ